MSSTATHWRDPRKQCCSSLRRDVGRRARKDHQDKGDELKYPLTVTTPMAFNCLHDPNDKYITGAKEDIDKLFQGSICILHNYVIGGRRISAIRAKYANDFAKRKWGEALARRRRQEEREAQLRREEAEAQLRREEEQARLRRDEEAEAQRRREEAEQQREQQRRRDRKTQEGQPLADMTNKSTTNTTKTSHSKKPLPIPAVDSSSSSEERGPASGRIFHCTNKGEFGIRLDKLHSNSMDCLRKLGKGPTTLEETLLWLQIKRCLLTLSTACYDRVEASSMCYQSPDGTLMFKTVRITNEKGVYTLEIEGRDGIEIRIKIGSSSSDCLVRTGRQTTSPQSHCNLVVSLEQWRAMMAGCEVYENMVDELLRM